MVIAGIATITTVVLMRDEGAAASPMTEENRAARATFFGTGKELPPIVKGQEIRPRW
jgi:Ti type entry exclusion protein TrbK